MKNNRIYSQHSPKQFHDEIVASLRREDFVESIKIMDPRIASDFEDYSRAFTLNRLEGCQSSVYDRLESSRLVSLYRYKHKLIQDLRLFLTTDEQGREFNTCQYCTLNSVDSMDHILPKESFPSLSVNCQNLFPCCTECNRHKSINWIENGHRQYLNLYLDMLPETQFLFVDISLLDDGVIDSNFYLDNRNGIAPDLFQIIATHYGKLYLCERFKKRSHEVIDEFVIMLKNFSQSLDREEIFRIVSESESEYRRVYGYNHWKVVLKLALINDGIIDRILV